MDRYLGLPRASGHPRGDEFGHTAPRHNVCPSIMDRRVACRACRLVVGQSGNRMDHAWRMHRATPVLPKFPHSNCCKTVPSRPLRGRRGRFGTLLQLCECGSFGRTVVHRPSKAAFDGRFWVHPSLHRRSASTDADRPPTRTQQHVRFFSTDCTSRLGRRFIVPCARALPRMIGPATVPFG